MIMSKNFVIFDCDGGSDDAWALLLLLKAEEEKRVIILGITICGNGNTTLHNAARNILRILKASGRDEIPIFLGANEALIRDSQPTDEAPRLLFHGRDGFGDILPQEAEIDIDDMVEGEHAVCAINQFCIENSHQVTVIAVGPLTNIALCYSLYAQQFANNVKEIYLMGGNHQGIRTKGDLILMPFNCFGVVGIGNYTRSAEFNFYCDPEAAHIVLSKSKCPITILPWEPCMEERFFICINWRLETFGIEAAQICPAVQILNDVERAQWIPFGLKCWNPCDAMLVAAFLFGDRFVRKESGWHATVDLRGCHTRGQMVLDHLHEVKKYPRNVRIIELVDAEIFKEIVRWSVSRTNTKCKIGYNGKATTPDDELNENEVNRNQEK